MVAVRKHCPGKLNHFSTTTCVIAIFSSLRSNPITWYQFLYVYPRMIIFLTNLHLYIKLIPKSQALYILYTLHHNIILVIFISFQFSGNRCIMKG